MNTVGIIGAMDIEVDTLKKHMKIRRTIQKAGMEFCEGVLSGQEAVVVKSGIGKVNAAVCTQILSDEFQVDAVINTGIAGSLKTEINIGDIVISTDLVQHDMDATNFGYPLGQIPQIDRYSFEADAFLRDLAKRACETVNPDIQVFEGRIVSGDQFVADRQVKDHLTEQFGAFCTEMEGAAIAQAAYLNKIPFVVLRAISDKADDSASMDYPTFERKAAEHCVNLVEEILRLA
jgi:adenosylhomocysteine nucleosidase